MLNTNQVIGTIESTGQTLAEMGVELSRSEGNDHMSHAKLIELAREAHSTAQRISNLLNDRSSQPEDLEGFDLDDLDIRTVSSELEQLESGWVQKKIDATEQDLAPLITVLVEIKDKVAAAYGESVDAATR